MVCTTYGDNPGLSQLQQQQPQHEQHYGHQHQHQQHEPARHSASSTAANRLPTCRRSSPCRLEDSINVSHISVEILTSPFCTCKARLESPTSLRTRYTSSWCCWCNWQQQHLLLSAAPVGIQHRRIAYQRGDLDEPVLHVQSSSREPNLTPNAIHQQLVLLVQLAAATGCCMHCRRSQARRPVVARPSTSQLAPLSRSGRVEGP